MTEMLELPAAMLLLVAGGADTAVPITGLLPMLGMSNEGPGNNPPNPPPR
ncbi:MAG: hypothetical protein RL748_2844 [Pseudomonadota bacterium]|jgi:hypothetical protein